MTEGQTSIPPVEGPLPAPSCAWCGEPAAGEVQIEKGRTGTHRGKARPVMARTAPACANHLRTLEVAE